MKGPARGFLTKVAHDVGYSDSCAVYARRLVTGAAIENRDKWMEQGQMTQHKTEERNGHKIIVGLPLMKGRPRGKMAGVFDSMQIGDAYDFAEDGTTAQSVRSAIQQWRKTHEEQEFTVQGDLVQRVR